MKQVNWVCRDKVVDGFECAERDCVVFVLWVMWLLNDDAGSRVLWRVFQGHQRGKSYETVYKDGSGMRNGGEKGRW